MNKEINVAFISKDLKSKFDLLKEGKFEDKNLYESIDKAIDELKINPSCGIKIPKNLWTKEYIKKYEVVNLWKYDLPSAWRLIYTVESDEIKIVSIILEWFNHKEYERKFKY